MSKSNRIKDILKEIVEIFSLIIEKMDIEFDFYSSGRKKSDLKKKFTDIDFEEKKNISFETYDLYKYIIMKIFDFLRPNTKIYFYSSYSVLYLRRIISYLQKLLNSNIDIVEDDLIKIFFYLFIIFFDEGLVNLKDKNALKIDLDETFFKGTFIELTEKYSSKVFYQDSKEIKDFIDNIKIQMEKHICSLIDYTFLYIKEILQKYGNKKDDFIKKMYFEANSILIGLDQLDNGLSSQFINKILNFYSTKYFLTFTNYISETEKNNLEHDIDINFLKKIENNYLSLEYNYSFDNNSSFLENHKDKLENYINYRNKYYQRMNYSSFPEVFKFDLNNEINIFAFAKYDISTQFMYIQKFKNKLENLEQKKIIGIIKDILNEDDFYIHYFSILECDIIKNFFTSHLCVNENDNSFQLQKNKSDGSECFKEIYLNFIKQYNKKNESYREFKNLIIFKILSYGDRAYTMKHLKRIVINPAQFFVGKEIKEELELKMILKGYLMVILLHETEHFFRLLDKTNEVFPYTPRGKEGGRMFIKYLFDVESINHINIEQANIIFKIDSWKDHNKLKKIFIGQLEDIEVDNINEFLFNYFKNSITFFTTRAKKGLDKKTFNLDDYIRK